MKLIYGTMAVAAGFIFSLCMFAVGAGTAAYLIAIEPQDGPGSAVEVADLWTATPRTVRSPADRLESLPPRTSDVVSTPTAATANVALQVADTGSAEIEPSPTRHTRPPIDILSQHVAWCFDRYRSYRTDDDSYTAYSGERRSCISPYTDELVTWAQQSSPELETAYLGENSAAHSAHLDARFRHAMRDETEGDAIVRGADTAELFYASADVGGGLSDEHVSNCFARYRSYRPEDNSYQPYGGGARQQCK